MTVSYTGRIEHRLAGAIETQIFRIAQEALTNIARHSGASRAAITLVADSRNLHLVIVDWGERAALGMSARALVCWR